MNIHRFVIDSLRWDLDGSGPRSVVNGVGYLGAIVPYFDTFQGLSKKQVGFLDDLSLRVSHIPLARAYRLDTVLDATRELEASGAKFCVRGCQLTNYEVDEGWKVPENAVMWRGYDPVMFGQFSLLREGIFRKPDLFQPFLRKIQPHGLLRSRHDVEQYVAYFRTMVAEDVIDVPCSVRDGFLLVISVFDLDYAALKRLGAAEGPMAWVSPAGETNGASN